MTSVTKEARDYEFFASSLKNHGISSLAYGMDGECAMECGFERIFPIKDGCDGENIHLRCFDHVRDDMKKKIQSLGAREYEIKQVTEDILGREYDGTRIQGLVDCESVEEFEKQYGLKEKAWKEELREWMATERGRVRPFKATIKLCMLRNVRIAAGLGNPPNKWSNQRTESLNDVLKEAASLHTTDQATVHEILEEKVIQVQECEYVKAIYCSGEYRLSDRFCEYAVGPLEWSEKTVLGCLCIYSLVGVPV